MSEGTLGGRVALVTGAASGIGRATALELASSGVGVAGVDIDAVGLAETARLVEERGARALAIDADLSRLGTVEPIVEQVVAELGPVDILVNAAGVFGQDNFLATTLEDLDWVFAINLRALFLLMQSVAARMVERGEGGRIVNVTSSSAFRALGDPCLRRIQGGPPGADPGGGRRVRATRHQRQRRRPRPHADVDGAPLRR
jgi:NAD(P)-dependent dehydrogenase (short-subunit alcohol dehydrogenase family)